MSDPTQDMVWLAAVGLFALAAGLAKLMARKLATRAALLAAVPVACLTAAVLAPSDAARSAAAAPAVIVLAWLVGRSESFARLLSRAGRATRRPAFLAVALLVTGLTVTMFASLRAERLLTPDPDAGGLVALDGVPLRPALVAGVTDRGREVELFAPADEGDQVLAARLEATRLDRFGAHQVIRRSPPDWTFNCHGWVFTGGRHWLRGWSVPTVLEDNGYKPVARPRADDVAIHATAVGEVTHTALVRAVLGDGTVMVESKWGGHGRFFHAADDHPFGGKVTYYRSPRAGHVLKAFRTPEATPAYPADSAASWELYSEP